MRAYVLLSGGIDSTTCLHCAMKDFSGEVVGLSMNYGQRHLKEIQYAKDLCDRWGVDHHTLDLSTIVPKTMLTAEDVEIPNVSYDEIVGVSPTYVPFRNGLMLSAAASFVVGQRIEIECEDEWGIYFGNHAEDSLNWAYPDCTPEFAGAMANAIYVGTYHGVRLHTPLQWLTKAGIIALGEKLKVNWSKTWSCYAGGENHCGTCPTCRARWQAFTDAMVYDPTVYDKEPEGDKR